MTNKIIFIPTKINNDQIRYHFTKPDNKKVTYAEFLNFLKNKNEDFLEKFGGALNSAIIGGMPAYFGECVPVSKETINKPFEFVITKSETLNNITQNGVPFRNHINNNHDKYACSFPSLNNVVKTTLIIPIPKTGPELDFKNISKFTENSPQEQGKEFWQEVVNKLSEELEKTATPKGLSTSGTGVSYLHVRICERPNYYVGKEYENFDKNQPLEIPPPSAPVAKSIKEKILQNLDQICIAPNGSFYNSELTEKYGILEDKYDGDYYDSGEAKKNGQHKIKTKTGEMGDLTEHLSLDNGGEIHREAHEAIIDNIKQNPTDGEIVSDGSDSQKGNFLRNKKNGIKHYKQGFTNVIEKDSSGNWDNDGGQKQGDEIAAALKNPHIPYNPKQPPQPKQPKTQADNNFPLPAKIAVGGVILVVLIIFIFLLIKRKQKK